MSNINLNVDVGQTKTLTFNTKDKYNSEDIVFNIETTGTLKAAAGTNINSVGTPTVGVSTTRDTTTLTFNYLKGATGLQGKQGLQGKNGTNGVQGAQGYQGKSGVDGVQGFQGLQGIKGTDGSRGLQGLQGKNGTNGTNGTNGAQGYQGYQGIKGTDGTRGLQGFQGIKGTDGSRGVQGYQGYTGLQGATGLQGLQGTAGTNGVQGTTGLQGKQGLQGTAGTNGVQGYQGYTGAQGATGLQGTAGSNGTNGSRGLQGYQGYTGLQGKNGINGTNGVQGLQGIKGINGTNGVQGLQGTAGSNGTNGSRGLQGYQGYQGKSGVDGFQGFQGIQGTRGYQGYRGYQGITGATGPQGPQGVQGIPGLTGNDGVQGLQGPAGTGGASMEENAGTGISTAGTVVTSPFTENANYILLDPNVTTSYNTNSCVLGLAARFGMDFSRSRNIVIDLGSLTTSSPNSIYIFPSTVSDLLNRLNILAGVRYHIYLVNLQTSGTFKLPISYLNYSHNGVTSNYLGVIGGPITNSSGYTYMRYGDSAKIEFCINDATFTSTDAVRVDITFDHNGEIGNRGTSTGTTDTNPDNIPEYAGTESSKSAGAYSPLSLETIQSFINYCQSNTKEYTGMECIATDKNAGTSVISNADLMSLIIQALANGGLIKI